MTLVFFEVGLVICGSQQELHFAFHAGELKLQIDDFQFGVMRSDEAFEQDEAFALAQFDEVSGIGRLAINQRNESVLNRGSLGFDRTQSGT
jgi:hypothetical protein